MRSRLTFSNRNVSLRGQRGGLCSGEEALGPLVVLLITF